MKQSRLARYAEIRAKELAAAETCTVLEPDGSLKEYIRESVVNYGPGPGIIGDPPAVEVFNSPGHAGNHDDYLGYLQGVVIDEAGPPLEMMTESRP